MASLPTVEEIQGCKVCVIGGHVVCESVYGCGPFKVLKICIMLDLTAQLMDFLTLHWLASPRISCVSGISIDAPSLIDHFLDSLHKSPCFKRRLEQVVELKEYCDQFGLKKNGNKVNPVSK